MSDDERETEAGEGEEKDEREGERGEMIMQFKIMLALKREEEDTFLFHQLHSFYVFLHLVLSLSETAHE